MKFYKKLEISSFQIVETNFKKNRGNEHQQKNIKINNNKSPDCNDKRI
jgi:uncharacterized protein YlbG (UPF0298 family)